MRVEIYYPGSGKTFHHTKVSSVAVVPIPNTDFCSPALFPIVESEPVMLLDPRAIVVGPDGSVLYEPRMFRDALEKNMGKWVDKSAMDWAAEIAKLAEIAAKN